MFNYYLRLALLSIRRNPILSGLMVMAIALGIGASMTTITINYMMSSDPIPHKSQQLFHVQVDSWDPLSPYDDDKPDEPPEQLTWTEATQLTLAGKAFRQSGMAKSGGVVEPEGQDAKPFQALYRLAYADFFPMFDVPFLYGNGWDKQADDQRQLVVVLSKEMNDRIFGGENSVGRNLRLSGQIFRVAGVLDHWLPVPKFYDLNNNDFDQPEDFFMPFSLKAELELPNYGNNNCWKTPDGEGFMAVLRSECINSQMWVELPTQADKQAYMDFLDSYVQEQKAFGRFQRPMNNQLSDVMQWLENQEVVTNDAQVMLWLSFMFLLVCLLNTIGLLLSKFSGKAAEIGLRRAVGATKADLFRQHIVETACIGLAGGILGLLFSYLGLQGIRVLYGDFAENLVQLDLTMVSFAIILALLSSIGAGFYPTWRACNIAPASQLKSQ